MKKNFKLYLGLFAFLLLIPMNVFALSANEIKDLLPNSFNVDLKESDVIASGYNPKDNKVSNEIQSIIDKVFSDNNISTSDFMVTFNVDAYEKEVNLLVYSQSDNDDYITYSVPISFNNSADYNETDRQKVETFINSHEFQDITECKLGEECNNDISGFNINTYLNELSQGTDIVLYNNGGGFMGGPLSSGLSYKVDLFLNDVCYGSVLVEKKYITVVDVPGNVVDKEAYILSEIKDYLVGKEWLNSDATLTINDNFVEADGFELGEIKVNYLESANYALNTNDVYALNSNTGISIMVTRNDSTDNIDLDNITVSIDDTNVEYSKNGNYAITIDSSVLNTFSAGNHTIRVVFNDGIGEAPINFDNSITFNVYTNSNIGGDAEVTSGVTPIIDNILNNREESSIDAGFWIDRMKSQFYTGFNYVVDVLGGIKNSEYVNSQELLAEANTYTHVLGFMFVNIEIGDGGIIYGKVNKLSSPVSLEINTSSLEVPEVENGYSRKYYLLTFDGEKVVKEEIEKPSASYTLTTDKFYEYAIVCEDTRDSVTINTIVSTDAGEVAPLTHESRNILADILEGNNVDEMDDSIKAALLNEILSGNVITIRLVETEISEKNIAELEAIKNELGEDAKLFGFFDLSIILSTNAGTLGNLTKLKSPITVVLNTTDLINSLPEVEDGYTRVFKVARIHGSEITYLDATLNSDKTLSVESDRFSTYIPYYVDTLNPTPVSNPTTTNPQTGDSIIKYIAMLVLSMIGLTVVYRKAIKVD